MEIGVPKEIKNREFRVGLTPAAVRELAARGHTVYVETSAGAAIGFSDELYRAAGARILDTAEEVFGRADLVVKVKEPQPNEVELLREGQILFTYLHLAPDPELTRGLLDSGCTAVAYETVTDPAGRLPLLAPMSEVAGRLSVQAGARALEMGQGGRGVLLGGVAGVEPGRVVVIGGGVVGTNAARVAAGMGADVTILDRSVERLHHLDDLFSGRVRTVYSTTEAVERLVTGADLVIGAVLVPGAAAPKVVPRELVAAMPRGSVLVDVAIDQGGCFATSRPTTHDEPTYVVDGVVHYCVANMPGAVARTSTLALGQSTLPYVLALADRGLDALGQIPGFRDGLNVHRGRATHPAVAEAHGLTHVPPEAALTP